MIETDEITFFIEHIKKSLDFLEDKIKFSYGTSDYSPTYCDLLKSVEVDISIIREKINDGMLGKPTKLINKS